MMIRRMAIVMMIMMMIKNVVVNQLTIVGFGKKITTAHRQFIMLTTTPHTTFYECPL